MAGFRISRIAASTSNYLRVFKSAANLQKALLPQACAESNLRTASVLAAVGLSITAASSHDAAPWAVRRSSTASGRAGYAARSLRHPSASVAITSGCRPVRAVSSSRSPPAARPRSRPIATASSPRSPTSCRIWSLADRTLNRFSHAKLKRSSTGRVVRQNRMCPVDTILRKRSGRACFNKVIRRFVKGAGRTRASEDDLSWPISPPCPTGMTDAIRIGRRARAMPGWRRSGRCWSAARRSAGMRI